MVIVAAVDGSDRATEIVQEADKLARRFETELHVVHVLNETTFLDLERSNVSKKGRALGMDEIRTKAKDIASDAASHVTNDFDAVGLVGNVVTQINTYAETHDAAFIVIGSRRRSPVGKVLAGSVTQRVLLSAEIPVVVV
ncbi:universal stress protein [Haloferax sp. DFSO52]|uniref:universal stress protein n=1 Tax=Haloferax sp. DFSO52 TaxID=3388505 RepID=UPI003A8B1FFC